MKPHKPKRTQRPELQHETDRLRRMNAPLATQWYVMARELADRLGMNAGGVLELFAEMAHTYTYDGSAREDAERRAWRDAVEILEALATRRMRDAAA